MALVDTISRIQAKGNDIRRRLMAPAGTRCFLLKRGTETKALAVVAELTTGWNLRYSEFRGQTVLEHADAAGDFADKVAQASFVASGVPDGDGQLDVYAIDPDRRDVVPPRVDNIFWKVYCTRDAAQRFSVPE